MFSSLRNCQEDVGGRVDVDVRRRDLIDDEAGAVSINAVVARDFRRRAVQRQIRVVAGDDATRAIPDIPVARAVCALDQDEASACREDAVDRLAAAVAGVAADLAHAGDGGEEISDVGGAAFVRFIRVALVEYGRRWGIRKKERVIYHRLVCVNPQLFSRANKSRVDTPISV